MRDRHVPLSINAFVLVLGVCLASLLTAPANACVGIPSPPTCGKSLVLSQAGPDLLLIPGGGTFDVPVVVYFNMADFPAGAGLCPAGPYAVDVDLTVTCMPAGDGSGSIMGSALVRGYNEYAIPVTLPAGPARMCEVSGTATVTLADGMVLTDEDQSILCLGDPAPMNPSLPRLDLELIAGTPVARVHPGDQSTHTYRITNNDPLESFTGILDGELVNTARLPGMSGPQPPGTGVFAISDPGDADNFPFGLERELFQGCLPTGRDPALPIIPTIIEPLTLGPGEFIDVDVYVRPWGMCADGSCGRGKLSVEGTFSDLTAGKACTGLVTAADIGVPPTFLWPDGGSIGTFMPEADPTLGALLLFGLPLPELPIEFPIAMQNPTIAVNGGLPNPGQMFAELLGDPERGRQQVQFVNTFQVDSFFDIEYRIDIPSQKEVEIELVELNLVGSAPVGFENIHPFAMVNVGLREPTNPGPGFDGFAQLTVQMSGVGIDNNGERRQMQFDNIQLVPDLNGFQVQLGGTVGPGTGNQLQAIEVITDTRAFFSQVLTVGDVFTDGFESGNVSAWSTSVP